MNKRGLLLILAIELTLISVVVLVALKPNYDITFEPTHPDQYESSVPSYSIPFRYSEIVRAASDETGVPIWLLARLINRESSWSEAKISYNPNGTRDIGIVQLNEKYLDDFSWRYNNGEPINPLSADISIYVCAKMLAKLYKATGSWLDAVGAYNCGLTRYRTGNIPESTLRHIDAIMGGV